MVNDMANNQVHRIVGGGFSGLLTAYLLARKGEAVELYEAGPIGGMIQSKQDSYGLVESAANGFLLSPLLSEISAELGLQPLKPNSKSKNRYFSQDRLRRWPVSLGESIAAIIRFVSSALRGKHHPRENESMTAWGERVFGKTFSQKIVRVGLQGIYASTGDHLSASLLMSRFLKPKSKPKFKTKGLVSFGGGMGEFTEALFKDLEQRPNFRLHKIKVSTEKIASWRSDPQTEKIWIATSISAAAELMESAEPALAEELKKLPTLPVVTGTFFFERTLKDPVGFGCLRDPDFEKNPKAILGVLFNDQIFAGRSSVRSETWIMGGISGAHLLTQTDTEIEELVLSRRLEMFGLSAKCLHFQLTRWPKALPLYGHELAEKQILFQQSWGKILLVGNYVNGIGLTKMAEHIHTRVENSARNLSAQSEIFNKKTYVEKRD